MNPPAPRSKRITDEGHVRGPDRDPDARLDEVALRVAPEVPAEVRENPRVRDLHVVIEPVAVHVDPELG